MLKFQGGIGGLQRNIDKLAREIEKMREELYEICKVHGYNLQVKDVILLSEKLDELIAQFQRLSQSKGG